MKLLSLQRGWFRGVARRLIDLSNGVTGVLPIANGGTAGATAQAAAANLGTWQVLAKSAVAVSVGATTDETVLATITVPAASMGPNGVLLIDTTWLYTNGNDDKIPRVRFSGVAGTVFHTYVATTTATQRLLTVIHNRNAANSQVSGSAAISSVSMGASSQALATSSEDTTAATTIVITGQKEVSGDTLTLSRYLVQLSYGA